MTLEPGDILATYDEPWITPHGLVLWEGQWRPASFDPGSHFLILNVAGADAQLQLRLMALSSGLTFEFATTPSDVETHLEVVKGSQANVAVVPSSDDR